MAVAKNVLLVGGGKMGGALLRGWLSCGLNRARVRVIEPLAEASQLLKDELFVSVVETAGDLDAEFSTDIIVFAVKPQGMKKIVPLYADIVDAGAVTLSIAAGRNIAFFEECLGADRAIVRTMPNTPAAIGRGITAAFANAKVTKDQKAACQALLEAVGEVVWLDDEGLIDAVTAVSGSGPAYVFLLIECLARAGRAQGLSAEIAAKLAGVTVAGAGELARQSEEGASILRENVTSRGGTTAAALEVLMAGDGLEQLMQRAVEAATSRSRELAG